MIDDALDFLTNYLGATGYRVNDDGEFESHVVESFTATEYGLDVTTQIDDCLSML